MDGISWPEIHATYYMNMSYAWAKINEMEFLNNIIPHINTRNIGWVYATASACHSNYSIYFAH